VGELTVLYDEGCGLCSRLAAMLARRPGLRAAAIGSPEGALLLRDLAPRQRYDAVHVVDACGRRRTGGAALPIVFRALPGGRFPAAALAAHPAVTEHGYRLVARNRAAASRALRALGLLRPASSAARGPCGTSSQGPAP
jgi:predicted DCC family thiol-disulfide oxidoreductase YuxK